MPSKSKVDSYERTKSSKQSDVTFSHRYFFRHKIQWRNLARWPVAWKVKHYPLSLPTFSLWTCFYAEFSKILSDVQITNKPINCRSVFCLFAFGIICASLRDKLAFWICHFDSVHFSVSEKCCCCCVNLARGIYLYIYTLICYAFQPQNLDWIINNHILLMLTELWRLLRLDKTTGNSVNDKEYLMLLNYYYFDWFLAFQTICAAMLSIQLCPSLSFASSRSLYNVHKGSPTICKAVFFLYIYFSHRRIFCVHLKLNKQVRPVL